MNNRSGSIDILKSVQSIKETERYLSFLYGGVDDDRLVLLCRIKTQEELKNNPKSRMQIQGFTKGNIKKVANILYDNTNKGISNYYCQIGVTDKSIAKAGKRSTELEITQFPAFYVDLDYFDPFAHKKQALPPDKDAVLNMVAKTFLKPSMIVHSGRGIHAYWILDNAIKIPEELPADEVKGINKSIHDLFAFESQRNQWKIDSVFDIVRILRIPGTINRKPGVDDIICTIEEDNNIRYSLNDIIDEIHIRSAKITPQVTTQFVDKKTMSLQPYAKPGAIVVSTPKKSANGKNSTVFTFEDEEIVLDQDAVVDVSDIDDLLSINPSLVQILKGSWDRHKFPSTSECDYEIAKTCIDARWSVQQTANMMIYYRMVNHLDTEKVLRPSYVRSTIMNARDSCRRRQDAVDATNYQVSSRNPSFTINKIQSDVKDANREAIGRTIGTTVIKLIKHTGDDPSYTLVTSLGDVHLPRIDDITSKTKFKNRLAAAINKIIELPKDWASFSNMLLSLIEEDVQDDSASSASLINTYLDEYYLESLVREVEYSKNSNTDDRVRAAASGAQSISGVFGNRDAYFINENYNVMYFFVDKFFAWIKDYRKAEFRMGDLRVILRAIGCTEEEETNNILKRKVWIFTQKNTRISKRVFDAYNTGSVVKIVVNNK